MQERKSRTLADLMAVTPRSMPINSATGLFITQLGRRSGLGPQGKSESHESQSSVNRVIVGLPALSSIARTHVRVRHRMVYTYIWTRRTLCTLCCAPLCACTFHLQRLSELLKCRRERTPRELTPIRKVCHLVLFL